MYIYLYIYIYTYIYVYITRVPQRTHHKNDDLLYIGLTLFHWLYCTVFTNKHQIQCESSWNTLMSASLIGHCFSDSCYTTFEPFEVILLAIIHRKDEIYSFFKFLLAISGFFLISKSYNMCPRESVLYSMPKL